MLLFSSTLSTRALAGGVICNKVAQLLDEFWALAELTVSDTMRLKIMCSQYPLPERKLTPCRLARSRELQWVTLVLKNAGSRPSGCNHEGFAQWFGDFDNVEIKVQQQVAESDRVVTQMLLGAVHREKHRKRRVSHHSYRSFDRRKDRGALVHRRYGQSHATASLMRERNTVLKPTLICSLLGRVEDALQRVGHIPTDP